MSEDTTTEAPKVEAVETDKKIEATRTNMLLIAPEDLVVVGLDTDDGPEHPLYDERIKLPLDKFMVQNIKTFGVKEPVAAQPSGEVTIKGQKVRVKYPIVFGRQRVRWGREANKELVAAGEAPLKIRVIVEKGDEKEMLGLQVLENEVRQDDDMLAKSRKAQRLINRGYSEKEAANVFGVATSSLRIWLKLLELSPEVQKAVEEKKLTASAAIQLKELPQDKQVEALKELLEGGAAPESSEDGEESDEGDEEEGEESDEGDEEEGDSKPKIKKRLTAKDVAAKAARKGAGEKTKDVAQAGAAPKRAQVRRALKDLLERKGQYARIAGAMLAWVIGDIDRRKEEIEELSEDVKTALREVIKASAKKKAKKPKAE